MTNDELKKKIVEVLEETEYEWTEQKNGYILQIFYDKLADALIAANIGDVSAWKHRAEVAEKAGRIIQRDMARVFDISNPRVCELIANIWDLAKKQAEKELAEEGKDGNKKD